MQKNIAALCILFCFVLMPAIIVCSDSIELLSEPEKAEVDAELKMIWTDVRNALAANKPGEALPHFSAATRQNYRELFKVFGDHLLELAEEMHDIEPVYIKRHSAKYEMSRAELCGKMKVHITRSVYWAVDSDGAWKIDRY
jgi:hypothetical protein